MPIGQYEPEIGDFFIWAGWFRTWYGVVSTISQDGLVMEIIWEGLPILLFTMAEAEQQKASSRVRLEDVVGSKPGNISVMKHDAQHNATVWYI